MASTTNSTTTPRKRTISEANDDIVNDEGGFHGTTNAAVDGSTRLGVRKRRNNASTLASALMSPPPPPPPPSSSTSVNEDDPRLPKKSSLASTSSSSSLQQRSSVVPLSMQLLRPFWSISCCPDCSNGYNRFHAFHVANSENVTSADVNYFCSPVGSLSFHGVNANYSPNNGTSGVTINGNNNDDNDPADPADDDNDATNSSPANNKNKKYSSRARQIDARFRTVVSMASFDNAPPPFSRASSMAISANYSNNNNDEEVVNEARAINGKASVQNGNETEEENSKPNASTTSHDFKGDEEGDDDTSPISSPSSASPVTSSSSKPKLHPANIRPFPNAIPATPMASSIASPSDLNGANPYVTNIHTTAITTTDTATSIEQILHEYTTACQIYGCSQRLNPGVLTTIRFHLPTLRVSGNFFDADMLALSEILLKHCNGALKFITRLDFTLASKEGKQRSFGGGGGSGKKGMRSHGAYALAKVLEMSRYIREVYLTDHRIGPFGAAAIFQALGRNDDGVLRTLLMRGCRIGEVGALAFVREIICAREDENDNRSGRGCWDGGLKEVDLSCNRIGFRGCFEIEKALKERDISGVGCGGMVIKSRLDADKKLLEKREYGLLVDLEGNLVFQEVMNCVTHGLGVLLATVGTYLLTARVQNQPSHYVISCAIYSASLITLYTSSTLYHSFFALKRTKFIFKAFDKCAIFTLISGSYTPFLMIALRHEPMWSKYLLFFIWLCASCGILVELTMLNWKHKGKFSLAMYLGMGWCALVCLPDLVQVIPREALGLLVAGGVAYTGGVPFFARNNNLDHSIWHMFVLAGSIFHWLCIYWHVVKL